MLSYEKIYFGSACNNRCAQCDWPADASSSSLNELLAQVDALADGENIELVGGEPTLHDGLLSLISYARRRGGRRIKLRTNGRSLADGRFLETLVQEGCRVFEVSLFGSRPDVHEAVTRARGGFNETLAGFQNLQTLSSAEAPGRRVYVTGRIGVTDRNVDDLLPTVSLLMSFGVDVLKMVRMGSDLGITPGAQAVATAMKVATLNRVWSMCKGFPPCTMKGSETHLMELLRPTAASGDKPKSCNQCLFETICAGPPEGYPEKRGTREFRAVRGGFPHMRGIEYLTQLRASHGE